MESTRIASAVPGGRRCWPRSPSYRSIGEIVVARPLVPRARVVPGAIAGRAQRHRGERRARARVAVRDDLRAFGEPDQRADLLRRPAAARARRTARRPRDGARRGCGPAVGRTGTRSLPRYSSSRRTSRIVSSGSSRRPRELLDRRHRLEAAGRARSGSCPAPPLPSRARPATTSARLPSPPPPGVPRAGRAEPTTDAPMQSPPS